MSIQYNCFNSTNSLSGSIPSCMTGVIMASDIADYPLPSTLCLNLAGAPTLSVSLDNIEGYLYSELRKGHL
ncbi:hypothetical protein MJN51_39905, partial [Salmonella enterica subsp. enterica serovar Kentucky]|nr:hypothetical protein [Salmonella enterica subsp. enterica serovar Kentucky]